NYRPAEELSAGEGPAKAPFWVVFRVVFRPESAGIKRLRRHVCGRGKFPHPIGCKNPSTPAPIHWGTHPRASTRLDGGALGATTLQASPPPRSGRGNTKGT